MKKIVVNRLFHGFCSCRDYQVEEAISQKQDLLFILKETEEEMFIPWGEIQNKIIKVSPQKFLSKHDDRFYSLIDFDWKPTAKKQGELL